MNKKVDSKLKEILDNPNKLWSSDAKTFTIEGVVYNADGSLAEAKED